ncbi:MAG: glycosyltransferase family 4 protein [Sphingomicrobium sp.]
MRILLVTEALVLGGAETFVLRLARRLRQDGQDAEILCLNPDHQDARLVGQFPDVPIHRVPLVGLRTLKRADRMGRWIGLDLDLQQRRAARWVLRHLIGRYDIHHSHLFGADWLFTRLKRLRPGLKIVSTLHGDYALYEERAKGTERTQILHWRTKLAETIRAVDRWVTISRAQHRQFETLFGVDSRRLVDIINGYAPPAPVPPVRRSADTPLTFVMVARGMREKGWGFLVDAFKRLDGDCRLMLVGEGAFLDQLRQHHGNDPQIDFAGANPNPVALIGRCDVFVHPSIYKAESMPTVIVEALFAGLPVIATDVGEVANMLAAPSGELAGTLLSPDEATLTDPLAAAMQAYLDDPALRLRHAALARAAFAKFDMGQCAAAYARLYAEVVGASSSSTSASH